MTTTPPPPGSAIRRRGRRMAWRITSLLRQAARWGCSWGFDAEDRSEEAARRSDVEQLGYCDLKPVQDVAAGDPLIGGKMSHFGWRGEDVHAARFRIDVPHQPRAGGEVLSQLVFHLARR